MKISLRGVAIMAASASLLAVPMALPASAAAAVPACKTLSTKTVKSVVNVTLSNCTPTAATGGKGTGTFKSNPNKSGTFVLSVKWSGTKGTTKATVKFAPSKTLGKCPKAKGASRIVLSGSVTGRHRHRVQDDQEGPEDRRQRVHRHEQGLHGGAGYHAQVLTLSDLHTNV